MMLHRMHIHERVVGWLGLRVRRINGWWDVGMEWMDEWKGCMDGWGGDE